MEKKFTKGEWKTLDKATFDSYQNVWRKALYIDGFNFCMYISGRTKEEVNANAKLIAAAPALLDNLNKLLLSVKAHPDYVNGEDGDEWHDIIDLSEKIIKKATE